MVTVPSQYKLISGDPNSMNGQLQREAVNGWKLILTAFCPNCPR